MKQTEVLKTQADLANKNLLSILSREDTVALNKLADEEDPAAPAPFAVNITQLMDLQVQVAKDILINSKELYRITSRNFILFIFLSLVIALSLSSYIIKNVKNLINDILKSKHVIHESEAKYRSLLDQASDAIYLLNLEGNFTDANESMCKMTGYSNEELLQLHIEDIIDPEQLKNDPIIPGYYRPDRSFIRERRILRKDGTIFDVEINVKKVAEDRILVIARDITERKQLEANIREAELKFRTLAEKSVVGVYILQKEGFLYLNPRFAEIFGYEQDELLNAESSIIDLIISVEDRDKVRNNVRARYSGEMDNVHYEFTGLRKDGTKNNIEIFGSSVTINGKPSIIGSMIDITERKIAEELIIKEKTLSETIINSLPGVFYLQAATGQYLRWNKNFETVTGYNKEEIVKLRTGDLIVEEDREKVMDTIKNLFTDGYATVEATAKIKDGTRIPFLLTGIPIMYQDQLCLLGTGIDISSRIQAEEALKKSEANLKAIMDTTDTAYALLDKELNVIAFNQMAGKFVSNQFNSSPEAGGKLADFVSPERFPEFMNYAAEALRGKHINYEINYPQADGSEFWYYVKLFPIANNQDEIFGLMIALTDVTERKMSEIHLEELNANLQKHAKELAISNAELEQFAYVASHDLQEPLRMVTSFLTLLEKKYGDVIDDKGKKYIFFAVDGAKRMRQIILDLLDFSRAGRTEDNLEEVDFNKLINDILPLYRRQVEKTHARIVVGDLPTLQTYRAPLRQVFQNLISNSLIYHKAGVAPLIQIDCKETKTHFLFSVKDNGIGISPEYFDKIFIIFQRLHYKEEYSGTGMGLAITKKIIENLDGKIWVESSKDNGATFYFTLLKRH